MNENNRPFFILMADDDPDDRLLAQEALQEIRLDNCLEFVEDGEQLMAYLQQKEEDNGAVRQPDLILLDLNMPRKDGREVIEELKANPKLRQIPVVVFTTSKAEEDIVRSYALGVNSFIVKPTSFEGLVDVMQSVNRYWAETVRLPRDQ